MLSFYGKSAFSFAGLFGLLSVKHRTLLSAALRSPTHNSGGCFFILRRRAYHCAGSIQSLVRSGRSLHLGFSLSWGAGSNIVLVTHAKIVTLERPRPRHFKFIHFVTLAVR